MAHHAVPEECPADVTMIQTYIDALVYRQWHIGDPVGELGAAVKSYMDPHLFSDEPWPHSVGKTGAEDGQHGDVSDPEAE